MGLVSRLEYMLDRFEAELAEHRRRLGKDFGLQGELDQKRAELAALEADLAANDRAAAVDDDGAEEVMAA